MSTNTQAAPNEYIKIKGQGCSDLDKHGDLVGSSDQIAGQKNFDIDLPSDKSLTHRFVIFAAMAEGESSLLNPSLGADCLATRLAMEAFGARFLERFLNGVCEWVVTSRGTKDWGNKDLVSIDAQNSGTTARLLIGLGAGIPNLKFTISGDQSLSRRPMARIVGPLVNLGAKINVLASHHTPLDPLDSRHEEYSKKVFLPIEVVGQSIKAFQLKTNVVSAQVKSALLLAASQAVGESTIEVPNGTRNHTENIMKALGADLTQYEVSSDATKFKMKGPWIPPGFSVVIPKDPSAMAFFAVLAFLNPGMSIRCKGVLNNPGRLHFLRVLERSGLHVSCVPIADSNCPGESIADFEFKRCGEAKPIIIDASEVSEVIDEIPALAAAATACRGTSQFFGLQELRIKESDRLAAIKELLELCGQKAEIIGDNLSIFPTDSRNSFSYSSDDHRMVMTASILTLCAKGTSRIGQSNAVKVSFPGFFSELAKIYTDYTDFSDI
ncbi:MAG: 3-phosphoshikimate 1-carboxyvinyltransferase [Proteobacteria bacterium]|nr:3-phosphoshikimate 1-carboxyvinyltransferase [Pseudomonadota bacterium]